MSSFSFLALVALFMSQPFLLFSAPLSLPSDRNLKPDTTPSTIAATPAVLPDAPFQDLSPDVAPLLPTSGGLVAPTPNESTLPTIPSNPSPPNPDDELVGPFDSAAAPFGALPGSSAAVRLNLKGSMKVFKILSFMAYMLFTAGSCCLI